MSTSTFPDEPVRPSSNNDSDEDRGWNTLCIAIAAVAFLAAWAVKTWLANPACAPDGWSGSCIGWTALWIILGIIGLYGLLGLACSRFIGAMSDR